MKNGLRRGGGGGWCLGIIISAFRLVSVVFFFLLLRYSSLSHDAVDALYCAVVTLIFCGAGLAALLLVLAFSAVVPTPVNGSGSAHP